MKSRENFSLGEKKGAPLCALFLYPVLFLPLLSYTPLLQDFDTPKVLFFHLLLFPVALVVFLPPLFGQALRRPCAVYYPLLLILLLLLAGIPFATNPHEGVREWVRLFGLCLFSLMLYHAVQGQREAARFLRILVFPALGVALYGISQRAGIVPWPFPGEPQAISTIGNTNFAAEYLITVIPLAIGFFLLARSLPGRLFYGGSVLILITHLVLTNSRGGWFAFGGGFVLLLAVSLWKRRVLGRGILLLLGPAAVALLLSTGLLAALPSARIAVKNRLSTVFSIRYPTNRARLLIWKASLSLLLTHPIRGAGAGNFEIAVPPYRAEEELRISQYARLKFAHNELLHFGAEGGFIVLALLLLLFGWMLLRSLRLSIGAASPGGVLIPAAAGGGVAAFFLHGLFMAPLHNPSASLNFFVLLGVLGRMGSGEKEKRSPGKAGRIFAAIVLLITLFTVFLTMKISLASACQSRAHSLRKKYNEATLQFIRFRQMGRSTEAEEKGIQAKAIQEEIFEWRKKGFRFYEKDFLGHYDLARDYRNAQNRISEAERSLRRVLSLHPKYLYAMDDLGNLLMEMKRLSEAEAILLKGLKIQPGFSPLKVTLAHLLMREARNQEALDLLGEVTPLNLPPGAPGGYPPGGYLLKGLLLEAENPIGAVPYFEQALKADPGCAEAAARLGRFYQKFGAGQEAARYFVHAGRQDPLRFQNLALDAGKEALRGGKLREAETYLTGACQVVPDNPEPFRELCEIYRLLGDQEKAKRSRALALVKEAFFEHYKGHDERARSLAKEAQNLEPGLPEIESLLERLFKDKEGQERKKRLSQGNL